METQGHPAHTREALSSVSCSHRGIPAKDEVLNVGWESYGDLLQVLALSYRQNGPGLWVTVRSKLETGSVWS